MQMSKGYFSALTMLPVAEVAETMQEHLEAPEQRRAQQLLADAVTGLVHGAEAAGQANLAAGVLFGGVAPTGKALQALRGTVGETTVMTSLLDGDEAMIDVLVETGLASSRGDARRTIEQNGVSVNGQKQGSVSAADVLEGGYVLLQKGKKTKHLLVVG